MFPVPCKNRWCQTGTGSQTGVGSTLLNTPPLGSTHNELHPRFGEHVPSFKPPQTIPLQHVVLGAAVVGGRKELEALNPSMEDKSARYPVHKVL